MGQAFSFGTDSFHNYFDINRTISMSTCDTTRLYSVVEVVIREVDDVIRGSDRVSGLLISIITLKSLSLLLPLVRKC